MYVICVCVRVLVIVSFLKGTRTVQIQEEGSFNIQLPSFPRSAICSVILAFSVGWQQSQLAARLDYHGIQLTLYSGFCVLQR